MIARPARRLTASTLRAGSLLGSAALVGVGLMITPAAADPAALPDPDTWTSTSAGGFSVVVPDGICSVRAEIAGGAGNNQLSGSPDEAAGQGALIEFSFRAMSGTELTGVVGAGANSAAGAAPGGGSGGSGGGHAGGGGGGYTELLIDSDTLALAGGGGGSGGGHVPTEGFGGDAGVPTGAGVFGGSDGTNGIDANQAIPGAGQGASNSGPGVGGVHSTDTNLNGFAGSGRTGGNGGNDPNLDTGAGGGGGYYGGGGGASTLGQGSYSGAGGGGGASYVSSDVAFLSGGLDDVTAPNGHVSLTWVPCAYDLAIDKKASAKKVYPNKPVTYTVKVTNLGTDPMGGGDTVTITDANAVGGTIKSVKASDGNDVTCTPGAGDTIATDTIECSRPLAGSTAGVRGLNVDETLTITYTKSFTKLGTVENTASITDRGDPSNNAATAVVKVVAQPLPNTGRDAAVGGGNSTILGVGGAAAVLVAVLGGYALRRKDMSA